MEHYTSTLKSLRESAGLTQSQLAEATGISRKTIVLIESEDGSNPQIGTAMRLMSYFNISFDKLYPGR